MSQITIQKAHLVEIKGGHGLNVTYLESKQDKKPKKFILESPWFAHKDLVTAMGNLSHHFAVRTFYYNAADIKDPKRPDKSEFERFHVHGISLSEDPKKHHVIISGHVEEEGSSPVNTHTPITWLKKDGDNVYALVDDLLERLTRLKTEIVAYIREEKLGDDPQGNLFDGKQESVTKAKIAEPLPKKTTGKVATKGQQAESVPAGDEQGSTVKLSKADPEAMKSVAETDNEELNGKPATKRANRRGGVQTPDNPGGEPEEQE